MDLEKSEPTEPIRGFENMEIEGPLMVTNESTTSEAPNPSSPGLFRPSWKKWSRPLAGAVALFLVVLLAAIFTPNIVTNEGGNNLVNAAAEDSSEKDKDTTAPASPTTLGRDEQVRQYLIDQQISTEADLTTADTPQQRALKAILNQDIAHDSYEFLAKYVLMVLYYSTKGERWIYNLNFVSSKNACDWNSNLTYPDGTIEMRGVYCNDIGQVAAIKLERNDMEGTLPSELRLLTTLENIDMNFNNLAGPLPQFFKEFAQIKAINFMKNQLTGSIPSFIGSLSTLETINLSHNLMTGMLPTSLTALQNLTGLAIDNNAFTGSFAGLHSGFPGLTKLRQLFADDNQFGGPLDDALIQQLNSLVYFDISNNYFIGSIPGSLFEHNSLRVLDVHANNFDSIPEQFPKVNTNLTLLAMQKCKFASQTIPSSISNLKALNHLDLSQNGFTGDIPTQIGAMNLTYVFLAQNDFVSGPIPSWIQSLSNLNELDLKSTKRTGTIPSFLGDLKNLVLLDLDNNHLEGEIPSCLGDIPSLQLLLLNRNNLTGSLPDSFKNLSSLKLMFLDANENITGSLDELFCTNPKFLMKPVIVAGCDLCDPASANCCTQCCLGREECNQGVFVPDMDPVWQLGYKRVFYTFGRDDFFEHQRTNMTGYEGVRDWLQKSNALKAKEGAS